MAEFDHKQPHGAQFIVASEVMCKFMAMVERVARHAGTVLITGETGTGKERIAHAIHEHSLRSEGPFIDINCAALPEHLVESELFGHEKGAYSGAESAKPGLFEMANSGTIFLDEIGELDLKVQVKLLRVLDGAPYYRLGGHRKIVTDARVVAATNRNLREEVNAGRFRRDLYHRLSQFELKVPPLRERPEDIAALAESVLKRDGQGLALTPEALRALQCHAWPGNVRELQNTMNKLIFSATSRWIEARDVVEELARHETLFGEHGSDAASESRLENLEAQVIQKALEKTGGHRGQAAVQLGISRRTLSRKLLMYGLSSSRNPPSYPAGAEDEDRQNFRADLRVPAVLTSSEGRELTCTTTNLSATGMGLEGFRSAITPKQNWRICFQLPNSDRPLICPVKIAWADPGGSAGMTFTDASPEFRGEVRRWLDRKMIEASWFEAREDHGDRFAAALSNA